MKSLEIISLIGGPVTALFSFSLAVVYDWRKQLRLQSISIEIFKQEIISNLEVLAANKKILKDELKFLGKEQHSLLILHRLRNNSWDLVKINPPRRLVNADLFQDVQLYCYSIDLMNSYISNRENFMNQNLTLVGFANTLKKHDTLILDNTEKIIDKTLALQPVLDFKNKLRSSFSTSKVGRKKASSK